MTAPVVLHISNEPALGPSAGFSSAFARLEDAGLLAHVAVAPLALLQDGSVEQALSTLRQIARDTPPDLVFVQSPHAFPWTAENVPALLSGLGSPTVVYWEGDAWGGRKPLSAGSAAWLAHADTVFSVGLGEQAALLDRHARTPVRYVPNVLPGQLLDTEEDPVPGIGRTAFDVAQIGNCYMRFGVLELVDGARERARLVRGLRSLPGCRVALYGSGWRGRAAQGPIPFGRQLAALRDARVTVGWNHYQRYRGVFSNRLPICMYAGRVHVSSRPPGVDWLPGPESGLHLVDSPAQAVDRVRELVHADPGELHAAGLRARRWCRDRLTDFHALLYMLGGELALPAPPEDPWSSVAAAVPGERATASPHP